MNGSHSRSVLTPCLSWDPLLFPRPADRSEVATPLAVGAILPPFRHVLDDGTILLCLWFPTTTSQEQLKQLSHITASVRKATSDHWELAVFHDSLCVFLSGRDLQLVSTYA